MRTCSNLDYQSMVEVNFQRYIVQARLVHDESEVVQSLFVIVSEHNLENSKAFLDILLEHLHFLFLPNVATIDELRKFFG